MKNYGKKWFISASSGLFGKFVLAFVLLIAGTLGTVYLLPKDSILVKAMAYIIPTITMILSIGFFRNLNVFREWSSEARADKIKEQELENEKLQLENENLKLKLELQEKRDNNE